MEYVKIAEMMMNKIFIFSFLFIWFLSCNKLNYSTPKRFPIVSNKIKVNKNQPVVIYGDTRNNYEVHQKIVRSFLQKKPTIVFNTGDLVYDGNNTELWPIFMDIIKPVLKVSKYYPVLGNHEMESDNYFKIFDLPNNERWYDITFNNITFFVLDSNSDLEFGSKQYLWLESKLRSCKSDFKILIFHHPILSVGRHGGYSSLEKSLTPLIKKYSIQLIFNGHDHAYQRFLKNDVTYVVTGGGGAPLYDKVENLEYDKYLKKYLKKYHYCLLSSKNKELSIIVYDLNNYKIDEFTIDLSVEKK
jgi:predicted phosphodiesterase